MNCESFQENLYEYLDGALSPSATRAAEEHTEACQLCRDLVQREKEVQRSMATRFQEAVAGVQLEGHVRRRILAVLKTTPPERGEDLRARFWRRIALPFAAAAALVLLLITWKFHSSSEPGTHRGDAQLSSEPASRALSIHLTYCVPAYTFRREGNIVIDSLSCEPQTTEGSLIVKN